MTIVLIRNKTSKNQSKNISKEGFVAFGYEGYFKVPSVMVVTAMLDSTSKRQENGRQPNRQKEFGQLLEDERERLREEENRLEGKTIGYTRTGQIYTGQTIRREYGYGKMSR